MENRDSNMFLLLYLLLFCLFVFVSVITIAVHISRLLDKRCSLL